MNIKVGITEGHGRELPSRIYEDLDPYDILKSDYDEVLDELEDMCLDLVISNIESKRKIGIGTGIKCSDGVIITILDERDEVFGKFVDVVSKLINVDKTRELCYNDLENDKDVDDDRWYDRKYDFCLKCHLTGNYILNIFFSHILYLDESICRCSNYMRFFHIVKCNIYEED